MKIGVVSDTHSREIPRQVLEDFQKVDLIVHAGDFCSVKDLEQLKKIKEVKAVFGNMDEPKVRSLLPEREIFKIADARIGVFHGYGPPKKVLESVREQFKGENLDAVIFGHSHKPLNERIEGVLYFNPGSPNDSVFAPYCSYGILEIKGKNITGKIIKVKNGKNG